jgi:hypothetical protein
MFWLIASLMLLYPLSSQRLFVRLELCNFFLLAQKFLNTKKAGIYISDNQDIAY